VGAFARCCVHCHSQALRCNWQAELLLCRFGPAAACPRDTMQRCYGPQAAWYDAAVGLEAGAMLCCHGCAGTPHTREGVPYSCPAQGSLSPRTAGCCCSPAWAVQAQLLRCVGHALMCVRAHSVLQGAVGAEHGAAMQHFTQQALLPSKRTMRCCAGLALWLLAKACATSLCRPRA